MIETESIPAEGIHPNVLLRDYLRWPILSQSVLKELRASPAHCKAARDKERVKEPTDAMLLGSALHTCFLEPERMPERVVLWDSRRAGKEWDAFKADHEDKVILTGGHYDKLVGMVKALRRHPFVREWSPRIEDVEVSIVGKVGPVLLKGRTDALTPDPLVDLKKVRSADVATITRTVMTFGYHIQASIYRRLYNRDRFVLLCQEDQPPYDAVAYELSPGFIRYGDQEADRLLAEYAACEGTGCWPGRCDKVVQLEVPGWLDDQLGSTVTIGGKAAFADEDNDEGHRF